MPTPIEDREKGWLGVCVNEKERRGVCVLKFVLLNFFDKHFTIFFTKSFLVSKRIGNHVFYMSIQLSPCISLNEITSILPHNMGNV